MAAQSNNSRGSYGNCMSIGSILNSEDALPPPAPGMNQRLPSYSRPLPTSTAPGKNQKHPSYRRPVSASTATGKKPRLPSYQRPVSASTALRRARANMPLLSMVPLPSSPPCFGSSSTGSSPTDSHYYGSHLPNLQDPQPSPRQRREFRPTYQQEEEHFIWYHRVDLSLDWPEVRNAYNRQFPDRQRRGFQGIQCKYYRCCESHGVPRVRERNRKVGQEYGFRNRLPSLRYDWMRPEHRRR